MFVEFLILKMAESSSAKAIVRAKSDKQSQSTGLAS